VHCLSGLKTTLRWRTTLPLRLEFAEEKLVLLGSPLGLDDGGVEVVEPALAALLRGSVRKEGDDLKPVARAVFRDEVDDKLVFLRRE
jgi:hypothetical protein